LNFEESKKAFIELGDSIGSTLKIFQNGNGSGNDKLVQAIHKEHENNPWFIPRFIASSLEGIRFMLNKENLEKWLGPHEEELNKPIHAMRIGVIMAGNVPLVGFHDFMTVLLSGNIFVGKPSSKDDNLVKILAEKLIAIDEKFRDKIVFKDEKIGEIDGIIATGSNNSARYFEYYFGKYPNIIRKSRTSAAVLTGKETKTELEALADDVLMYFGLGCRNVSKIFIPADYKIEHLIDSFNKYSFLARHNKYMNNYEYNKAIYLVNQDQHLDNGFLLFKEDKSMYSPLSVVHYQRYHDKNEWINYLQAGKNDLQCVVGKNNDPNITVNFGEAQSPPPWEYADNMDTMAFLVGLNKRNKP
jgi:hypothetical protein